MPVPTADRLHAILAGDQRPAPERDRLVRLMELLAGLPAPPDPGGYFPRYDELRLAFAASVEVGDAELVEERFLELYAHLHMHQAPYTPEERRIVDSSGGYWSHAGGLAPLLRAGPFIRPDTVSADLGAGNGLQALLLQRLDPHRLTIQVEISAGMIEIGRGLQRWLDIPAHRVRWVVGDVREASVAGVDFLYLYRPVRPDGPGRAFYERIAAELETAAHPVVIFSVADCLRGFLSDRFELLETDGHLTCLRSGPAAATSRPPMPQS